MRRLQQLPAICALILSLSRRLESRTVSPDPYDAADFGPDPVVVRGGGTRLGGYGHRTVPADAARKIRDNEERPYETAGTYAYMTRPTSKSSRTRVPDTEKRPPGADDVELIYGRGRDDDRSRDYGESRTSDRKTFPDRYGYVRGAGPRYVDRPVAKRRYVGGDGERIAAGPEAAGSSGDKNARKTRKKNGDGGANEAGRQREEVDVMVDEPGKQKIVKKNEYSKKREFFDEEHVKNPARVAEAEASAAASSSSPAAARDRVRKGQQKNRVGEPRKKRKRRAKKVKKNKKRVGGNNFGGSDNYAAVSSGYGQILAVR